MRARRRESGQRRTLLRRWRAGRGGGWHHDTHLSVSGESRDWRLNRNTQMASFYSGVQVFSPKTPALPEISALNFLSTFGCSPIAAGFLFIFLI